MRKLLFLSYFIGFASQFVSGQVLKLIEPEFYTNGLVSYFWQGIEYNGHLYTQFRNPNRIYDLVKLDGDSLVIIPNPDWVDTEFHSGYTGYPILAHDKLYLRYNPTISESFLVAFDGENLDTIAIPENYVRYSNRPFVIGNKLYTRYTHKDGFFALMEYDGDTMKVIETPNGYRGTLNGYQGYTDNPVNPEISDDTLYLKYQHDDGFYSLCLYDGNDLKIIPNPIECDSINAGFTGDLYKFQNHIYTTYKPNNGSIFLVRLEKDSLVIVDNPEGYSITEHVSFMTSDNLYMYLSYRHENGYKTLFAYDGNSLTEISNPNGYDNYDRGVISYLNTYYDAHLFLYKGNNNVEDLMYVSGSSLTKLDRPLECENGGQIRNLSLFYDNSILLCYRHNNGFWQLVKYDGDFTLIDNPPGYNQSYKGFTDNMILYQDKVAMRFIKNDRSRTLCLYDGNNITEIPNLPIHNGVNRGYQGYPIIYNDRLLMSYENKDNGANNMVELISNTSVKEYKKSPVKIFPNPINEIVNLKGLLEKDVVCFYDLEGKKLIEKIAFGKELQVNLKQSRGIYIVEVKRNGEVIRTKKVVKQ